MRVSRSLLAVCALLGAVLAVHASHQHVVMESRSAPGGWTSIGRASPSTPLELLLLVKQQNLDVLTQTLWAVSDPDSPAYGQHLSRDEVDAMVAPKDQHVAAVLQWIASHGIQVNRHTLSSTSNQDMLKVKCTVAQAERLLHAEYHEFAHEAHKEVLVRTLEYSVPTFLREALDTVGPTTRFPSESTLRTARGPKHGTAEPKVPGKPNDACSSGTTPACLKQLYSVGTYVAKSNSTLAVTGYLEQYISESDLAAFFAAFDPTNARTATIVGPNDQTNPGTEASLDIQYSMGVASGVPGTFIYTAGRQPNNTQNEPFLDFLMSLNNQEQVPWVISTSYGDDEPSVDFNYASRMNVEFQKLGVRGVSILFSSGDGGVSGGQAQMCTKFIPTFPAGSPYVTAVGGTTSENPEIAASFSSGGFSDYWAGSEAPYQQASVSAYLTQYGASTLPPSTLFNSTGRGIPDVSAAGTNYPVYVSGNIQPVDGTSCSTPTFAGIVALLNDVRFQQGKSALGFLNPLLYKNPQMFQDIESGNNPGCFTNGFTATQGWDPVTGLGTPNFAAMAKVVSAMP